MDRRGSIFYRKRAVLILSNNIDKKTQIRGKEKKTIDTERRPQIQQNDDRRGGKTSVVTRKGGGKTSCGGIAIKGGDTCCGSPLNLSL